MIPPRNGWQLPRTAINGLLCVPSSRRRPSSATPTGSTSAHGTASSRIACQHLGMCLPPWLGDPPPSPGEATFVCYDCGDVSRTSAAWALHRARTHNIFLDAHHYATGPCGRACATAYHTRLRLIDHLGHTSPACLASYVEFTEPLDPDTPYAQQTRKAKRVKRSRMLPENSCSLSAPDRPGHPQGERRLRSGRGPPGSILATLQVSPAGQQAVPTLSHL